MRYDPELTPLEKILYAEISALTNSRGYCWAGNKYFARLYGKNENYISAVINRLAQKGYLIIEMEKGGNKRGSERVILLPSKYFIPPSPTSEKPDVAQTTPAPTSEKPDVGTLYCINNNNNTKEYWSFPENDLLSHFKEIWKKYPLKLARKEAFKHFKSSVKTEQDLRDIKKALDNYLKHLSYPKNSWKQKQQGKTWFNNWHDWVDWQEPETAEEMEARHKRLDGLIVRAAELAKTAFMAIAEDEFEHVRDELVKQQEQALRSYKLLCVELQFERHYDYKPEIMEKILRRANVDKGD